MIFISAQPDGDYFIWQLKVQICNLQKLGFDGEYHMLINEDTPGKNMGYRDLVNKYAGKHFKFYFYTEPYQWHYIAAVKPKMVSRHLEAHYYINEFFYMDSDVIFRELPDFTLMPKGCWASDTVSYIGAEYLKSKGEPLFNDMCSVVGIAPQLVIAKQKDSGGAQYLLRETNSNFWLKVYKDSIALFNLMKTYESRYIRKNNNDYPAQTWCAEMWATLWNLWLIGDCKVHKELDFCMATDLLHRWNETKIMHNNGVTEKEKNILFFKGEYISSDPLKADLRYVQPIYVSAKYADAIKMANNNQ